MKRLVNSRLVQTCVLGPVVAFVLAYVITQSVNTGRNPE